MFGNFLFINNLCCLEHTYERINVMFSCFSQTFPRVCFGIKNRNLKVGLVANWNKYIFHAEIALNHFGEHRYMLAALDKCEGKSIICAHDYGCR